MWPREPHPACLPLQRHMASNADRLRPGRDVRLPARYPCPQSSLSQDARAGHTLKKAGTLGASGQPRAASGPRPPRPPQEVPRQAASGTRGPSLGASLTPEPVPRRAEQLALGTLYKEKGPWFSGRAGPPHSRTAWHPPLPSAPSHGPSHGHRLSFPDWVEFQGALQEQGWEGASLPAYLRAAPHPLSLHTAENVELLPQATAAPKRAPVPWEEKPGPDQPEEKSGRASAVARRAWRPGDILGAWGWGSRHSLPQIRVSAAGIKLTFLPPK